MKKDKIVYLLRHGQTAQNIARVFQSETAELNDKGIEQAKKLADRLSKVEFEALISSPFKRARQTAEIISQKTGKKVEFSNLFVERGKPAGIDGRSYDDKVADELWREWTESQYDSTVRIEDGENLADLISRADKALELLTNRPESSLAVVSHGFFLKVVVARILLGNNMDGAELKRFQQRAYIENTGVTVIKYTDAFEENYCWRLWTLNDHSHFAE